MTNIFKIFWKPVVEYTQMAFDYSGKFFIVEYDEYFSQMIMTETKNKIYEFIANGKLDKSSVLKSLKNINK